MRPTKKRPGIGCKGSRNLQLLSSVLARVEVKFSAMFFQSEFEVKSCQRNERKACAEKKPPPYETKLRLIDTGSTFEKFPGLSQGNRSGAVKTLGPTLLCSPGMRNPLAFFFFFVGGKQRETYPF